MKANRRIFEQALADYEERSKGLHSFLHQLKETTTKHGTDAEQFRMDQIEAENDAQFYDQEIARLKKELAEADPETLPETVEGIPPQAPKQGVSSLIISSISFVVGAIFGSKLKSRKN